MIGSTQFMNSGNHRSNMAGVNSGMNTVPEIKDMAATNSKIGQYQSNFLADALR
jgi:hypothetical protein